MSNAARLHEAGHDAPALSRLDGLLGRHAAAHWPTLDEALQRTMERPRWIGWRLRLLVFIVLASCLVVAACGWWLTEQPRLPVTLKATGDGHLTLQSVDYPTLHKLEGQALVGLRIDPPPDIGPGLPISLPTDMLLLQQSARWMPSPAQRDRLERFHAQIDRVRAHWRPDGLVAHLRFAHTAEEPLLIAPRGWAGVSVLFWLLAALALAVFLVGAVVLLAGLQARNAAFAVLTTAQSAQLMLMALHSNLDFFAPGWLIQLDLHVRVACDLCSAAALVQVAVTHPHRQPGWVGLAGMAWSLAAATAWGAYQGLPREAAWWGVQIGAGLLLVASVALMTRGQRLAPHPFTLVMRRFTLMSIATGGALTAAIALGETRPDLQRHLAVYGAMIWHVFVATELLLSPYLSRTRQVLQEFSLLAASSTVAASLDLLFVAVFSMGQFTSMTLSLFLALGVYMVARRWLLTLLPGRESLSMEKLFQHLYRIAREVERQPDTLDASMLRLMRELFDPLQVSIAHGSLQAACLRGNGAVLLVGMPRLHGGSQEPARVLVLQHAHKGRRLFTLEDASLAERIVEQLQRALNFDQAVEQGRTEERLRIAQDLHDDIGARLLTLMYQAPNPEIEQYIRHTIQDLKTLTRGLAAQSHSLMEAAAEWKRDLHHRASVAECRLDFDFSVDTNLTLTMVQWSALTRILRELVSNALSHARATHIAVHLSLAEDRLTLTVEDNGIGRTPSNWSHGLGLGGVRKRVKQLGGSVRWVEAEPSGIRCEVTVEPFAGPGPAALDDQVSH